MPGAHRDQEPGVHHWGLFTFQCLFAFPTCHHGSVLCCVPCLEVELGCFRLDLAAWLEVGRAVALQPHGMLSLLCWEPHQCTGTTTMARLTPAPQVPKSTQIPPAAPTRPCLVPPYPGTGIPALLSSWLCHLPANPVAAHWDLVSCHAVLCWLQGQAAAAALLSPQGQAAIFLL